ncbi:MAG TPA: pyridoxamine 5'-phosphate oxidase family protein [Actinomycetota bacterium]|nr:pyridoxamine 5'-phosphate oxidase family protein [Actinomycetota bacterium]
MASWTGIVEAHPDFAGRGRELFDVHKHKTLATLRRDGSPRISGTEISFVGDDIWFGGMWMSQKARDLRRDARFALHGPTVEPDDKWKGDVKIAGTAEEVEDDEVKRKIAEGSGTGDMRYHLFRADISEMVITSVAGNELQIEVWKQGKGLSVVRRT